MSRVALSRVARPTRWCALISGRGSNLASLLEKPGTDLRLVATSDAQAGGVAKARRGGVPVFVIPRKESGALDWNLLDQELKSRSIDAVFLLGFMRIVPPSFVNRWSGRILNLHPSLLPLYPGLRSIERAFHVGDDVGCTVHEVVVEVDAGPILVSRGTLSRGSSCSLSQTETLVHIDEQRIVKETVDVWRA